MSKNKISKLASCRISDVVATAPGREARGGAIYVMDGQLHLTNTSLTNNLATSPPAVVCFWTGMIFLLLSTVQASRPANH